MDRALLALLDRKDFEYITVSEVCAEAKVNRSTFYLHYENTKDLLDETIRHIIDEFLAYFPVELTGIAHRFHHVDRENLLFITEEYIRPYLTYVRDNRRVFSTAMKHSDVLAFGEIYRNMFQYIFNPILERFQVPEPQRRYLMMFYLNGINAIVQEWICSNCEDDLEEIGRIIIHCVVPADFFQNSI